jgi:hypothetical protein
MDEDNLKPLTGSRVISTLAEVYKQLYLCPGREGQAQYDDVVKRGRDVEKKSLTISAVAVISAVIIQTSAMLSLSFHSLSKRNSEVLQVSVPGANM